MIAKRLRQLASESLVYGLSGVLSRFLSFFLVPVYTRIFTPEDYGVMSLVTTTMAVVSIFAVLALDNSAHRWYWDSEATDDRKATLASWAWCQLLLSCLLALAICGASHQIAQIIVGRGDAALYFQLTALALPLTVLSGVTTNWLRMQRRAWATVAFTLAISVLNITLTVILVVVLRRGLTGVYAAQLATAFAATLLSGFLLRDWVHPRHFRQGRLREMLRYALPIIPSAIALWVLNLSGRYFVQYFGTTSQVGLYQVAGAIAGVVALATGAFQQAWAPFAMSIHKQALAREVYANVLLTYTWLACLASTAISLLAPEAIGLLATDRYLGASTAVSYLAFSYVMIGLGYIAALGPSLAMTTRPIGIAVTCGAVLNLGLSAILVPRMGKEGAALSTLLSQSVVPIYLFYRSQQLYYVPYRFGPMLGTFALSAGLLLLAGAWRPDTLIAAIAGKAAVLAVFIPAAFLLRIVTLSQVQQLLHDHLAPRMVT